MGRKKLIPLSFFYLHLFEVFFGLEFLLILVQEVGDLFFFFVLVESFFSFSFSFSFIYLFWKKNRTKRLLSKTFSGRKWFFWRGSRRWRNRSSLRFVYITWTLLLWLAQVLLI